MRLIYGDSLGKTVDAVNEALFYGRSIDDATREAVGDWISARAGMPGAYSPGMVAPTAADMAEGFRLFTGEVVTTRAGIRHILGEEACRVLVKLEVVDDCVDRAIEGTAMAMERHLSQSRDEGRFCCRNCSVALWRNLAVGGLRHSRPRLRSGISWLKASRTQDGRWGNFPFYYTLLTLLETDVAEAKEELQYVRPVVERTLHGGVRGDQEIASRRQALLERVLAAV